MQVIKLAALILSAAALAACDGMGPNPQGPEDDVPSDGGAIGTPITTFTARSSSGGCPDVRPRTVLVDATHDGGVWWFPQTAAAGGFNPDSAHQGRALANYLRDAGYTVRELGRGTQLPTDSMLTYATVIRAGYYYDAQRPGYSDSDLDAYAAFVACPRTLVLLSDWLREIHRDVLADSLGIPLKGLSPAAMMTDFTPHALTAGVDSVRWGVGSYLDTETGAGNAVQILGRVPSGEAVLGVLAKGDAKIFWMGDTNSLQWLPQPFLQNLVAWGFD
jgi:hypothetical protein